MINKKTLIIVFAVLAAAGAGAYFTGIFPKKEAHVVKEAPTPIPLSKPFIVNLADTDSDSFIRLQLAVELDRMGPEDLEMFKAGGHAGGHGSPKPEDGGPYKVANYPPFHDAVIEVSSRFSSAQLLTAEGKKEFKQALLQRFEQIAEDDAPVGDKKALKEHHNPALPPYHVTDVHFQEFAIQAL
jgi:flagellar basal body-associated protein FliL